MAMTKKKKLIIKIVCIVLAVIVGIFAVLGITFVSVWNNEISTVNSFKMLRARNDKNDEGSVYLMKVKGGFYFDDFLASGGASSDKELIGFITNKITRGLVKMSISETDIGCSSFTAKTESGDILFGRNYDFDKTNVCITICDNPGKGRYKSFSTVDLNYVGMDTEKDVDGLMNKITCLAAPYAPLDGINEKGVSCGIYMSYQGNVRNGENASLSETVATSQNDPEKDNITSTTMLRMVLDYADSTQKAVELISKYNLHDSANTSFHYMIADANGVSAILEWVPENGTNATDTDGTKRVLKVTYNNDARYADAQREYYEYRGNAQFDYQWITNYIVQDGYYQDDLNKRGFDRYKKIYSQLKETGGIVKDEQAAMDILASVGRRTWRDEVSGYFGVTVHSAVYNLTKKTVLWVANENYSDKTAYYQYSLETGKLTTLA